MMYDFLDDEQRESRITPVRHDEGSAAHTVPSTGSNSTLHPKLRSFHTASSGYCLHGLLLKSVYPGRFKDR